MEREFYTWYPNIREVKRANKEAGYYFFETSTMGFFSSITGRKVYGGKYFITSEQFDYKHPRLYTIRMARPNGDIETIGEFQGYTSKYLAEKEIKRLLESERITNEAREAYDKVVAMGLGREAHLLRESAATKGSARECNEGEGK